MKKILTAMSGGVDSAVCTALLRDAGYDVTGATMLLHEGGEAAVQDAAHTAKQLEIPFLQFNWSAKFRQFVIEPFKQVYQTGGTPNPCVFCNQALKFGAFLDKALDLGFDGIATGHYAHITQDVSGAYYLETATDDSKDQTYMLYGLTQRQLSHTLFPMGSLTKEDVRKKAAALRLSVAQKNDSQDICFVPDGDYLSFLLRDGVTPTPGKFVSEDGAILGTHLGIEAYTIGQRRGLNLALGERVYVLNKLGNDVVVGAGAGLFTDTVDVAHVNWISGEAPRAPIRCEAKLRYTQRAAPCTVHPVEHGMTLHFDTPQRAVTAGQSAVVYLGKRILGGGIICQREGE